MELSLLAVGAMLLALALAAFTISWCAYYSVERLEATDAVVSIYQHWADNPRRGEALPAKLRGAFWMCDNPGQEMGMTFEGAKFDAERRTLSFCPGGTSSTGYMWTYDSDISGWYLYVGDRFVLSSLYVFRFDDLYTRADIDFFIFGIFPLPRFVVSFDMEEIGPEVGHWQRTTRLFGRIHRPGTYVLKRVIDAEGAKLPAFYDMAQTCAKHASINGSIVKTQIQLVPKPLLCRQRLTRRGEYTLVTKNDDC